MKHRDNLTRQLLLVALLAAGFSAACAAEEAEPTPDGPSPCSLDTACGPGQVCDGVAQICVDKPPVADATGDVEPVDVPSGHDIPPDVGPDTVVDTAPDVVTDGPAPDPCETGGLGCPCAKGSECDSGFCVTTAGGKVCSAVCTSTDECGDTLACLPTAAGDESIPSYLCLAPEAKLCQPCDSDADCLAADGGLTVSRCFDYGDEGRFCGQFCGEDGLCDEGYTCEAVDSVDGVTSAQCVKTDATCECRPLSKLLTLGTPCAVTNGEGSCSGTRVCGPTGLTECDGVQAAPDVCDGADNDCDGEVDEETCDDGVACTTDACDTEADACVHTADHTACDDAVACTNDLCDLETGGCIHEANDGACDDGDQCTTGSCDVAGGCSFAPAEAAVCDDGDPCTDGDVCAAGACSGEPNAACCVANSECDDENPCTQDSCDAETNTCVFDGGPLDGTVCTDSDGCTVGDTCQVGLCQPGIPATCGASPNPCEIYGCVSLGDEGFDCQLQPAVGGTSCSDQDPCTEPDACDGTGLCISGVAEPGCCSSVADCDDANPCTVDACDAASLTCTHSALPDATVCSFDDDGCTVGDACALGLCVPGALVDCGAPQPCTTYACDSLGANTYTCLTLHSDSGTSCEDGLACTGGDACDGSGQCLGSVVDCGLQAGPCRTGLCDEAEGGCTFTNLDNGTDCDADANGCTVGDSCTSGFCLPGTAADCSSYDDVCITGICQSLGASGFACGTVPQSTGSPCENSDYCTVDDVCDGDGACVAGTPRDCQVQVGDQCNTGWCDGAAQSCVKSKVGDGTVCEDAQACTLSSGCQNGVCVGADDVCVDARLDVTDTGANSPSVDSLGYGRYVVQWAGLGSSYARISDAHGSREGEELVVGEVSDSWISGVAGTPTGTFSLLYRTPSSTCTVPNCNLLSCGWSNCTSYETIEAVTYGAGGLALTSGPVTVLSTNALGKGCQNFPVVDDARTYSRILPFSDLGVGAIVSWNPTFKDKDGDGPGACDLTFEDPAFDSLLFTPLTGDLAAGASLELLPAADLKDASSFDAAVIPDGTDRFLLAWVTGDGKSVLVQSFLKGGQPDALDPWTVVNGVDGETVYSVRLMASADGVFAVLWDAEGGDADGRGILARRFYPDGSPLSPTMQVNLGTLGDQRLGDVGAFSDGSWVAVYDDEYGDTVGWGVKARRFSADDTPSAEMNINTNEDGEQTRPTVGVLSSDQWVTVFLDDQDRVWTRRFYKDGTPSPGAPERRANGTTQGDQTAPRAAQSDEGTVLVVYESPVPGQEDGEILARAFGVDGLTVGEELQVNTTGTKSQSRPVVAGGPNRFVVVWESLGEDGSLDGVYARLLDGSGFPLANPFAVNVTTASYQRTPAVAMRSDGQFAIAWSGYNPQPGLQTEIYLRIFDIDAGQLADEMIINQTVDAAQDQPAVAPSPTGQEWVVAWESVGQDGSGTGIYMRKVSSSGALLSEEIMVNETASGDQQRPSVAISGDGASLAICWETSGQDAVGTWGIACTILDYDTLNATVPEFIVNTHWSGDQRSPSIAFLSSGELLVAWETEEIDGNLRAVHVSRISAEQSTLASRFVANRTWAGDQYAPFVTPLASGGFWVGWETDNQDGDGAGVTYRVLPSE